MFIKDLESKKQVQTLELSLTRAEAQELRDDLETLLKDGTDRHEHVSSADYQTEITVWISDNQ